MNISTLAVSGEYDVTVYIGNRAILSPRPQIRKINTHTAAREARIEVSVGLLTTCVVIAHCGRVKYQILLYTPTVWNIFDPPIFTFSLVGQSSLLSCFLCHGVLWLKR